MNFLVLIRSCILFALTRYKYIYRYVRALYMYMYIHTCTHKLTESIVQYYMYMYISIHHLPPSPFSSNFYPLLFFLLFSPSSDAYRSRCESSLSFPDQLWRLGLDAARGDTALQEWNQDTTVLGGQMQSAKVQPSIFCALLVS